MKLKSMMLAIVMMLVILTGCGTGGSPLNPIEGDAQEVNSDLSYAKTDSIVTKPDPEPIVTTLGGVRAAYQGN